MDPILKGKKDKVGMKNNKTGLNFFFIISLFLYFKKGRGSIDHLAPSSTPKS